MLNNKLTIRLFGEFSIKSSYYEFKPSTNNSSQLTILVAYLIANKDVEISKDKLTEVLWPDENTKNQTASLRNLVYRARKELHKLYPDEDLEYICFLNDCYCWNPELSCDIDIYNFEKFYKLASKANEPEARFTYFSTMHLLYTGEFLPACTTVEWVLYRNVYYRNLFIEGTIKMCAYLYDVGKYDDIISLCYKSCLMYQEEERFHRYTLMAYLAIDVPTTALEYYHTTINFFSQKFGIDISDSLKDIYQEIISHVPNNSLDIKELEDDLRDHEDSSKTFYCNFDIFKNFYQLNLRSARRSHSKHYLLLLTLHNAPPQKTDPFVLQKEMDVLFEILSTQLRRNDIYTRTSLSQYSVILTVPNEYGSQVSTNRILDQYEKKKMHADIFLESNLKLIE